MRNFPLAASIALHTVAVFAVTRGRAPAVVSIAAAPVPIELEALPPPAPAEPLAAATSLPSPEPAAMHAAPPRRSETPPPSDVRPPDAASAAAPTKDAPLPRFSIVIGASTAAVGGGETTAGRAPVPAAAPGGPEDEASAVSVPAYLVSSGRPEYPEEARGAGIEGDAQLEIVVDASGRVVDARLIRPAGHGFDESALRAIRTYRFAPAQRDGVAVRVRMPWTVSFRLE